MGCGWIGVWRHKNKSWTNGRFSDKKNNKIMQYEIKVELDWREKKMGV